MRLTSKDPGIILADYRGPYGLVLLTERYSAEGYDDVYVLGRRFDEDHADGDAFEPGYGFFPIEHVDTRHTIKGAALRHYMQELRALFYRVDTST